MGWSLMFSRKLGPLAVLLAVPFVLGPSAAGADTVVTGETPSGAFYRIEAPNDWQPADGLVIFNHGITLEPVAPVVNLGPLVDVQLLQGYAVAASSYSLRGWAMFQTAADIRELLEAFETAFAPPDEILIYGESLGGLVTVQAVELGDLGPVTGALTLCGAVGGSRLWDAAVDLRLLYDFVCAGIPEAAILGGPYGLPYPYDPAFDEVALASALDACTGYLQIGGGSAEQQANMATILDLSGLPESFLYLDMIFAVYYLYDLTWDTPKFDGAMAMDNARVIYGDPAVDAGIERVVPDPVARARLAEHYTPTGEVGAVKFVSIHTDKDGLVIVENESEYASLVPPDSHTVAIAIEDLASHCLFTPTEKIAAWEALRAWVAGGPQPSAADIQADCEVLALGVPGMCRFDPNFVIPDLDERIRPRDPDRTGPPPRRVPRRLQP